MDTENKYKGFAERLRQLRKNQGLSQKDLAVKLSLGGHAQVSRYESGQSLPDVTVLNKIAELFEVDLHWLITGKRFPAEGSVRAKFKVECLRNIGSCYRGIEMSPVHCDKKDSENSENEVFSDATPNGEIKMCVKSEAASFFELGREYYIDFIKADIK